MTKKKTPALPEPTNHFVFLIDESGSMQHIRSNTIAATNEMIETVKREAYKSGQLATVTQKTFSCRSRTQALNAKLEQLRPLSPATYCPSGMTALRDVVYDTIREINGLSASGGANHSILFVVVTDGDDTCSATGQQDVNNLLKTCVATDHWSFAFLVPPGSGAGVTHRWGLPDGNVKEWEQTSEGVRHATQSVVSGLQSFTSARASGKRSVTNFFSPDLSKVTATKVANKLDDLTRKVKISTVSAEEEIRPFVENHMRINYERGHAFYQLMKKETVQGYKEVILFNKKSKKIFGGVGSRAVLGLPDGDVKVDPGIQGEWDIFVQSTSVNRKLPRGTKVAYLKG